MNFRILPTQTHDAYMNMAYDEITLQGVKEGTIPPTIRLFGWTQPSITIGYFQCLTDEVDITLVKKEGIPITRRITGGGAVYHDQEITYSVVAPEEYFSSSIRASYGQIVKPIMTALQKIGVETHFRPLNDIIYKEKKISGNAQTRKGGVLLQHGTIILRVNQEKMFSYLTPDANKTSDKPFIQSNRSSVIGIEREYQEVHDAIRKEFIKAYRAQEQTRKLFEHEEAKKLAEKYRSEEWTGMR